MTAKRCKFVKLQRDYNEAAGGKRIDGYYAFQTGKLFSEDKDAIILEIQDLTSNYNVATVFVVDVFLVDSDPSLGSIIRLDNSSILLIYLDTQVVDAKDSPLQKLETHSWNLSDLKNEEPIKNIFYWNSTNGEWSQNTK